MQNTVSSVIEIVLGLSHCHVVVNMLIIAKILLLAQFVVWIRNIYRYKNQQTNGDEYWVEHAPE